MADVLVTIHGKRLGISAPDATGNSLLLLDGVAIAGVAIQEKITALKNDVATLAAKINAINAAIKVDGVTL